MQLTTDATASWAHARPEVTKDFQHDADIHSKHWLKGYALLEALPSLDQHSCSYGVPGGFVRRLTEDEGTWLGHVLEHVAIEVQQLAGAKVTFGKTRSAGDPGQPRGAQVRRQLLPAAPSELAGVVLPQEGVDVRAPCGLPGQGQLLGQDRPDRDAVLGRAHARDVHERELPLPRRRVLATVQRDAASRGGEPATQHQRQGHVPVSRVPSDQGHLARGCLERGRQEQRRVASRHLDALDRDQHGNPPIFDTHVYSIQERILCS